MPIAATPVADEVLPPLTSPAPDVVTLLPSGAALLEQLAERTPSGDVRSDDWLARSGPTEFTVLLGSASQDAETAAARLMEVVVTAGVPGLSSCAGIAGLSPTPRPARSSAAAPSASPRPAVGGGRVIRYSGGRR